MTSTNPQTGEDMMLLKNCYRGIKLLDSAFASLVAFVNQQQPITGITDEQYMAITTGLRSLMQKMRGIGNILRLDFGFWQGAHRDNMWVGANRMRTETVFWLNGHRRKLTLAIERARASAYLTRLDPALLPHVFYYLGGRSFDIHISNNRARRAIGGVLEQAQVGVDV